MMFNSVRKQVYNLPVVLFASMTPSILAASTFHSGYSTMEMLILKDLGQDLVT